MSWVLRTRSKTHDGNEYHYYYYHYDLIINNQYHADLPGGHCWWSTCYLTELSDLCIQLLCGVHWLFSRRRYPHGRNMNPGRNCRVSLHRLCVNPFESVNPSTPPPAGRPARVVNQIQAQQTLRTSVLMVTPFYFYAQRQENDRKLEKRRGG